MTLRDAPTPRMAGHLPFMRAPMVAIDAVAAGQVVAFGVPIAGGPEDTGLGPLALRETSAYFGSHFSANMKAAMDIDRRMRLDGAAIAGRLVDLGDVDFHGGEASAAERVAVLAAELARRAAIPAMLCGSSLLVSALRRGLETGLGKPVVEISPRSCDPVPPDRALLVRIDLAAIASIWHGGTRFAALEGLSLSQFRAWLRDIGGHDVAGIAVCGLDPTRQGLSTVKTGQRLLVTAILDLVYARLGALRPMEPGQ